MSPIKPSQTIHLILKYGPLGLVRATASCCGPNSLLVDTGRVSLTENSEVEVVLTVRRGQLLESLCLPARIGGCSETGAQLTFSGSGISALTI